MSNIKLREEKQDIGSTYLSKKIESEKFLLALQRKNDSNCKAREN